MYFSFLKKERAVCFIYLFFAVFLLVKPVAAATTTPKVIEGVSVIDQLKSEIGSRNDEIKKLQQEIEALDVSIKKTEGESKTLKNELSRISDTITQLNKQVSVTETKIRSTELNIQRLLLEIGEKEKDILSDKESVGEMLKKIFERDLESSIEIILSRKNFSEGWSEVDSLEQLQKKVNERIAGLEEAKKNLIKNKNELGLERIQLTELKSQLLDQKKIASQNKIYKNNLLVQTQNKEENYKKILADRKKRKESLEREMFDFEAQLKVAIDPSSYPRPGTRVLNWPIDNPRITQKFGKTADSGRLYASGTHNGVDFGARQGTPVRASAPGYVSGVGDTDTSCDGVSYGKWVLIRHPNGLSTLYAHLDLIRVYAGQEVDTGEIVGYSGNTGYSEGPHLHFTVFVANAVHIAGSKEYKSKICGTYLRMPLAPINAYLDPLVYLPMIGSNVKVD